MEELRFHPWFRIPQEMRDRPQWVAFKIIQKDGREVKMPVDPRTGREAKIDDPSTWTDFHTAATSPTSHLGFAFTEEDPFIFIDLDTGKASDQAKQLHEMIVDQAGSYCETSVSGKGYHIYTTGDLPFAGTNDHTVQIEIYRAGRFALVTGDQCHWEDIHPQQDLIDLIVSKMPNRQDRTFSELVSISSGMTNEEVYNKAATATNGDKFVDLWQGNWHHYPELNGDHSTADLSLLTFLDYYCKDVDQVIEMFMQSALYRPEKGRRNSDGSDYILRSLEQARIRNDNDEVASIMTPEDEERGKAFADAMMSKMEAPTNVVSAPKPPQGTIPLPPGLIGEIAQEIYASAIRPVPEIALAGAMAMVAGLAGRQYNTHTSSGLNLYIMMLAETGRGKEGASNGIDRILSAVRPRLPMIHDYRGPASIRSGQALAKYMPENPCFFSVIGEVGYMIQAMASARANSADVELRRQLLDLYGKSGWHQTMQSSIYSDKEKNAEAVKAPSLTILGEGTQDSFMDHLDQKMVSDGLVPRFSFIEYKGKRPPLNKNIPPHPPEQLIEKVSAFAETCISMAANENCLQVWPDAGGKAVLDSFDQECDAIMNSGGGSVYNEIYNRAHLQALRIASLVAVGCNWHTPKITEEMATWAVDFVRRSTQVILGRFEQGETGTGDHRLANAVSEAIKAYMTISAVKRQSSYSVPKPLALDSTVVPYSYLRRRLRTSKVFTEDRRGSTNALKATLQDMVEAGELGLMTKKQCADKFNKEYTGIYFVGESFN
ncbi:primase/helicase [Vibrio phage 033B]|nr:primase/helicase [Vibrio phage 033B]